MLDADLIREFADRACGYLSDVRTNLQQLETTEDQVSGDLVDSIYQSLHKIVCTADSLGLVQIFQVSRRLENLVDSLRHRSHISLAVRIEVISKTTDRLKSLLQSIESSNDSNNRELCEQLDALLCGMGIRTDALVTDDPPATTASNESRRRGAVPRAKAPTTGPGPSQTKKQADATEISAVERIEASLDAAQSGIEASLTDDLGLNEGGTENR
ncbi:Hpt domain protein [Rubripirellula tenax]|uniref:Hpt domain protein n=1 Tax=Rubripirellula tenax TaxID=2528015 RepID=A0A5C6EBN6_9BACT|nr:Hpt domain-containing protein [Rubripirellula tenax]TWU46308.1 Hpt domain protein [Rubripirellula tenax]